MKNVTDFLKTVEIGVNQRLFYSHFIPQVTLFFEERGNLGNQKFSDSKMLLLYGEKNHKNSHFGKT